MGVILDSSVLIADERGRFDLPALFRARAGEEFFIAAITASELLHGVERANTPERREKRSLYVEGVLRKLPVIDFELAVARRHARLWAELEVAGRVIGPHDLLIAATALDQGHSVATLNEAEFASVPGLRLENLSAFVVARN
ncbi:MAG: type II toxin-antitoxin system VapC family toxin [Prosthecobacter sp.]|jgi:tRNA(fMet)-specific endonuclease VapC|uniref:type II toxin-antitoxin system VapC family toxin n=1 Tax=Prosthecobacter sp. TaxID=1965333 RepID=UPI0019EAF2B2|nr:type II toxin-antitoxin system VapC family toxin [Prosthecobacter sp.]MBE2285637.1 type II toxin-antitoxin system VapC family toxin [Prosthecobacter sp.]